MAKERGDLSSIAIKVDGLYLEDIIPGYKTLNVKGREMLARKLDTYSVGSTDGETVKGDRYPARKIDVEFTIASLDFDSYQERFDRLMNILSADEVDVVFNGEPDKYYTGTFIAEPDMPLSRVKTKGRFQIYCVYPFKRSVEVITQTPTEITDSGATFQFVYNGNHPARPILRAEFAGALAGGDYSEDGDCGFVAFMDDEENIIQLGNPSAIDLDATKTAAQLVNRIFTDASGWQTSGGKTWGGKAVAGSMAANQNITDANWAKGVGQTMAFAKPSYGTGANWHGPILIKPTEGATNFELDAVHRMCASANNQLGSFELGAYNVNGSTLTMVAGIVIEKAGNGTNGIARYIVGGKQVATQAIDLSYYNGNFGYCKKTAVYRTQWYNKKRRRWQNKRIKRAKTRKVTRGYTYTQSNLNIKITKSGSVVRFDVGNLGQKSYNAADVETMVAHNISMHFGARGSSPSLHTNAIRSVRFTRNAGPSFADTQNVFTAGDIVEADCNDASVNILRAGTEEGHLSPQYGARGNDWEGFVLTKGLNIIHATWSPWVDPDYKPTLKILYNEVFI